MQPEPTQSGPVNEFEPKLHWTVLSASTTWRGSCLPVPQRRPKNLPLQEQPNRQRQRRLDEAVPVVSERKSGLLITVEFRVTEQSGDVEGELWLRNDGASR
jgi:hypothetical protein